MKLAHALALLPLAAITTLAACSTSAPHSDSSPATPSTGAQFPLVIDNCGTEVVFDEAPREVLAIKSTSIEMLLALGLKDRILGIAFPDGPVAAEWADQAEDLRLVSEKVPGPEATLDLGPDLVYAGWESNITAEGAGDRDTLASAGIDGYISPAACTSPGYRPNPLTFDDVFQEITEVGAIFDASAAAEELVAAQRQRLEAVKRDTRDLSALWFSSGSDTPFVGGGIGAPQMVMSEVGLTNIADDIEEPWSSLGWESIIADDPDVIVLVDSEWNSAEQKIEYLEGNPATASMSAVTGHRYITLPFPASEAGARSVEAVETLASQLTDLS